MRRGFAGDTFGKHFEERRQRGKVKRVKLLNNIADTRGVLEHIEDDQGILKRNAETFRLTGLKETGQIHRVRDDATGSIGGRHLDGGVASVCIRGLLAEMNLQRNVHDTSERTMDVHRPIHGFPV